MADIAGTNLVEGLWKTGEQFTVVGKYTVAEDLSSDTVTFSNIFPKGVKNVVDVEVTLTAEIDSNASATGTVTAGDGTDADGFVLSSAVDGAARITHKGDGALIGTAITGTDLVLTFGTLATAVTSGVDIFAKATYICGLDNNG